jgi:hypothetical protein
MYSRHASRMAHMLSNCPPELIEKARGFSQDVVDHCDPLTRMILERVRKENES